MALAGKSLIRFLWRLITSLQRGMGYLGFVQGTKYDWTSGDKSKVETQESLGKKCQASK